jgi:hypothetical protein
MKLNPIGEKKTTEERMRGKRKPPEEKCKEEYPKARGWSGNDLRAGGESLHRIILPNADLLGALHFLLQELGLDPVTYGGRVGVDATRILRFFTVQLGTPRERYDEYSSKLFPQKETKVCRIQEKAKLKKVMLASFATAPDNL